MPIAIIVVLVAAAAAIGFTVLRSDAPAPATLSTDEVARPLDEGTDAAAAGGDATESMTDITTEVDTRDAFTSGMAEPIPEPLDTPVATMNRFRNGSYTTAASYFTPARTRHDMDITLTISDDIVTDAVIIYDGGAPETGHHRRFDDAYKAAVIGQPLANISLARVGGASLTSEAFNEAVDTIEQQAS